MTGLLPIAIVTAGVLIYALRWRQTPALRRRQVETR